MKNALLVVLLMLPCSERETQAWSPPGHAAVAAIAYRELAADPTLRANLTNLLESHPEFPGWEKEFTATKQNLPAGLDFGMFLFIRASTWPDEIRDTKDPALQPFDHPNWHFVDYPLSPPTFTTGPAPKPDDDVLFGINESLKTLADKNAGAVQRAAALSWLIHLVGDIHQPLHCGTLITAEFTAPDGDRGGNSFLIFTNAAQAHAKQTTKLHSFWDGRLGTQLVPNPATALRNAKTLKTAHPRTALSELSAGDDITRWSAESRDDATNDAYQFKSKMLAQKKVLPSGYTTNANNVSKRRIALAGYRLSDELGKVAF